MGKRVIVFGGSGFLGSHVADALQDKGHDVTIFDLKVSSYIRSGQKMVLGDILNPDQVAVAIKGQEIVYHFAGLASLDDAATRPVDTIRQNITGTVNLLEACVEAGVKRFVYASSIYVYSGLGGFYRCSKQAAELYVEEYRKRYNLSFTILRFGSLYGLRSDNDNGVWRFLSQGFRAGKVVYPGTGNEIREYIHVKDASKLSVDVMGEEFVDQHIVITGHHPMKVADMLEMIQEILGKRIEIEYQPDSSGTHYNITPYSFMPKTGRKLVSDCYIDMGQGMLECLHELSNTP